MTRLINSKIIEDIAMHGSMEELESAIYLDRWVMLLEAGATTLGFDEWLAERKQAAKLRK